MESLFTEEQYMTTPSIYDSETIESLKTKIGDAERAAEAYTAERSQAEKNARSMKRMVSDMQTVLLRKLQAKPAK